MLNIVESVLIRLDDVITKLVYCLKLSGFPRTVTEREEHVLAGRCTARCNGVVRTGELSVGPTSVAGFMFAQRDG